MKRTKWKGVHVRSKDLRNQIFLTKKISRSSLIVPRFLGFYFSIHNGKNFKRRLIKKEMLNHKFGEFSKTRVDFKFKKKKKK